MPRRFIGSFSFSRLLATRYEIRVNPSPFPIHVLFICIYLGFLGRYAIVLAISQQNPFGAILPVAQPVFTVVQQNTPQPPTPLILVPFTNAFLISHDREYVLTVIPGQGGFRYILGAGTVINSQNLRLNNFYYYIIMSKLIDIFLIMFPLLHNNIWPRQCCHSRRRPI